MEVFLDDILEEELKKLKKIKKQAKNYTDLAERLENILSTVNNMQLMFKMADVTKW